MAIRTYILTRGKHTRKEFGDGEPVTARNKGRKDKERPNFVHYSADGNNEIKMDEADAAKPGYAHLGLVLKIGAKLGPAKVAPAKAADPAPDKSGDAGEGETDGDGDGDGIVIPEDWQSLGLEGKRELAAKISGRRANRSVSTCDNVIQEYIDGLDAANT